MPARGRRTSREAADVEVRAGVSTRQPLSPNVHEIIKHLCDGKCHTFGDVLEWCESRGDCQQAVICPGCSTHFLIDDDELNELRAWTNAEGKALVCGVRLD